MTEEQPEMNNLVEGLIENPQENEELNNLDNYSDGYLRAKDFSPEFIKKYTIKYCLLDLFLLFLVSAIIVSLCPVFGLEYEILPYFFGIGVVPGFFSTLILLCSIKPITRKFTHNCLKNFGVVRGIFHSLTLICIIILSYNVGGVHFREEGRTFLRSLYFYFLNLFVMSYILFLVPMIFRSAKFLNRSDDFLKAVKLAYNN